MKLLIILIVSLAICINTLTVTGSKYSKDANINFGKSSSVFEPEINVKLLEKPYRMAKLNLLWTKAQVDGILDLGQSVTKTSPGTLRANELKQTLLDALLLPKHNESTTKSLEQTVFERLTEPKLKSLFTELKIHDKEEITYKRIRSEGSDKEGLKEAELRKKLIGIMSTYGLLEHFDEVNDPNNHKNHQPKSGFTNAHLNKNLFKDKKLNKLWEKAEHSGFTAEELLALKEEFLHHQDKIDQYYSLLNESDKNDDQYKNSLDENLDRFNIIDKEVEEDKESNFIVKANEIRDKHRDIKDGFDRLHRLSVKGPRSNEFVEPKVQGLWKLATETNFTADELESLKVELFHYEKRLLKLRHLQVEASLTADSHKKKQAGDKITLSDINDETVKKQARKVEKLHLDLEARIMQKHIEL